MQFFFLFYLFFLRLLLIHWWTYSTPLSHVEKGLNFNLWWKAEQQFETERLAAVKTEKREREREIEGGVERRTIFKVNKTCRSWPCCRCDGRMGVRERSFIDDWLVNRSCRIILRSRMQHFSTVYRDVWRIYFYGANFWRNPFFSD